MIEESEAVIKYQQSRAKMNMLLKCKSDELMRVQLGLSARLQEVGEIPLF